jgi:hypothetical protein
LKKSVKANRLGGPGGGRPRQSPLQPRARIDGRTIRAWRDLSAGGFRRHGCVPNFNIFVTFLAPYPNFKGLGLYDGYKRMDNEEYIKSLVGRFFCCIFYLGMLKVYLQSAVRLMKGLDEQDEQKV